MSFKTKALTLAILGATAVIAQAASLGPYAPVTDERLQNPEPKNWLMYRGNYSGWATARSIKSILPTSRN